MTFITRNAAHFQIKIVKYAAHVLSAMWKHKNLHELLKLVKPTPVLIELRPLSNVVMADFPVLCC